MELHFKKQHYNEIVKEDKDIMPLFQERVKELMIRENINQKELSKRTGISEASLSRYLKGTTQPRMDVLINIANAFKVDVNTLTEPTQAQLSGDAAFEEAYSLVTRNRSKLTEEQKRKIIMALIEK